MIQPGETETALRDWYVFALACAWKIALLVLTAQPIPAGDAFFYDGAVVHALHGGNYANPSLSLVLPISGNEVFSAYPPLHQAVLWLWLKLWGPSVLSAMWLQLTLFVIYGLAVIAIFRAIKVSAAWASIGSLFFFGITFLDRPDTIAFACGMWSLFAVLRAAQEECHTIRGNRWHWIAAGLTLLTICASVHIGAIFALWGCLFALAVSWRDRAAPPIIPAAAGVLVLAGLIALIIFDYPRLWAGFQEHLRETPTLAVWTVVDPGGLLKGNLLKLARTAPALIAVLALTAVIALPSWRDRTARFKSDAAFLLGSGATVVATLFVASLGLLMQNPINWCAFLQPLLVGIFASATLGLSRLPEERLRWFRYLCVGLAAVTSIRAIGMATWGASCALDVSQSGAVDIVRDSLGATPTGSTVIVSSAFLYEADAHNSLRVLHADWVAPYRRKAEYADCVAAIRPSRMILTQFDYYRGCGTALPALKSRKDVLQMRVTNFAHRLPPDAFPTAQRIIQHISWAPVIVDLEWQ